MSAALTITTANFSTKVMDSDKPVLVDFWATWCGPCRNLSPVIEEIAEEYGDRFVIGKVNVDEEPALAGSYKIMSIPALLFFKDGKKVGEFIGGRSKAEIVKALEQLA